MPCSALHALIVFNDRHVADTFLLVLHKIGFEATAANSYETAVALARSLKPDVLIIDRCPSGLNGKDLAARIAREVPDCEVVLFSAKPTVDVVFDSETADHYFKLLMKPVHFQDVLNHLAVLSARRVSFSRIESHEPMYFSA